VYPLIDNLLNWLEETCGGVVSTGFFLLIVLYMQVCLLVGMVKIGLRYITLISIHPIE